MELEWKLNISTTTVLKYDFQALVLLYSISIYILFMETNFSFYCMIVYYILYC